ncbi:hypothetical protein Esti_000214 [Eimeria stiedai]
MFVKATTQACLCCNKLQNLSNRTVGILTFSVGSSSAFALTVAHRFSHPGPSDISLVSPCSSSSSSSSGSGSGSSGGMRGNRRLRRDSAAAEAFKGCCLGFMSEETPSLIGDSASLMGCRGLLRSSVRMQAPQRRVQEHEAQLSLSVVSTDAVASCRWVTVFLLPRAVVAVKPQLSLKTGFLLKVQWAFAFKADEGTRIVYGLQWSSSSVSLTLKVKSSGLVVSVPLRLFGVAAAAARRGSVSPTAAAAALLLQQQPTGWAAAGEQLLLANPSFVSACLFLLLSLPPCLVLCLEQPQLVVLAPLRAIQASRLLLLSLSSHVRAAAAAASKEATLPGRMQAFFRCCTKRPAAARAVVAAQQQQQQQQPEASAAARRSAAVSRALGEQRCLLREAEAAFAAEAQKRGLLILAAYYGTLEGIRLAQAGAAAAAGGASVGPNGDSSSNSFGSSSRSNGPTQDSRSSSKSSRTMWFAHSSSTSSSSSRGRRLPAPYTPEWGAAFSVSVPLMARVRNSRLNISEASKKKLLGFCDASVLGEEGPLLLYIRYAVGNREFERFFADSDFVLLP